MVGSCPLCRHPDPGGSECPGCGVDVGRFRVYLATMVPPMGGSPADSELRRPRSSAGFWLRGVALLVDALVLLGAQATLTVVVDLAWGDVAGSRVFRAGQVAFPFFFLASYSVLCHLLWGQTVGKALVGVRVVSVDGGPIGAGQSVRRFLLWTLGLVLAGVPWLVAAARADKRAMHDLGAGTRAERVPAEPATAGGIVFAEPT